MAKTTLSLDLAVLRLKIKRVVDAEVEMSWRGSKLPAEHAEIELELHNAKADLDFYLGAAKVYRE